MLLKILQAEKNNIKRTTKWRKEEMAKNVCALKIVGGSNKI